MRTLVVHAHLYQPPRENPWTEVIERQPSATPFHDWNERVSDECYERLGAAGVRGPDGRIVALVNLYGRISFNIGPTLANWLASHRPDAMRDAAAGDRAAVQRTGHGSALMQAYGHPILPLCDDHEKRLQIAWGRDDFIHRYGRAPEGIWLPECAVDTATLEACADAGLRFTVLAPEQIVRVRPGGGGDWADVSGCRVPPHRPYLVRLPSGRSITAFVFDGPLSRGVAFGGALRDGEALLGAFRAALDGIPENDGLVLMAADGETFGHHQRGAEGVLAEALLRARMTGLAQVSHLGELLHLAPATFEAQIGEPSAWSCAHGVGRWMRDCGCGAGAHGYGWNWSWRQVLRHAVSLLRDRVFALIERRGGELFRDPWAAAGDYGRVLVHHRSYDRMQDLLDRHCVAGLDDALRPRAASLLELVRQTLFSSTSCGWFFDDIAGLEAQQVLRHAARAAELCHEVFGIDPGPDLARSLEDARANEPGAGTGADVYRDRALASRRSPEDAAAAHGCARLRDALVSTQTPAAATTTFGAYTCAEKTPPRVDYLPDGHVEVSGTAAVQHTRTGATIPLDYALVSEGPGLPVDLTIDGHPAAGSPPVREALLAITAWRARTLLPAADEAVLARLAWIGRQARELGAPIPSPFPEAIRGGARALVQDGLSRPPDDPQRGVRVLSAALDAARSAGLTAFELADLRPALDRQLAAYAAWGAAVGTPEAIDDVVAAVEATRLAAGEAALSRTRRFVVDAATAVPDVVRNTRGSKDDPGASGATGALLALLGRIGAAAGLAPDALVPLEGGTRADGPRTEARRDAQTATRSPERPDARVVAQTDAQPDARPNVQADARPDARHDAQADAQAETVRDTPTDTPSDALV